MRALVVCLLFRLYDYFYFIFISLSWVVFLKTELPSNHKTFYFQSLIYFNNKPVQQVSRQKHLGLISEISLTFDEHTKAITSKVSKTIDLLRKINKNLPRSSLTIIYKSFVRPHLDYGDVLFDKVYNNSI